MPLVKKDLKHDPERTQGKRTRSTQRKNKRGLLRVHSCTLCLIVFSVQPEIRMSRLQNPPILCLANIGIEVVAFFAEWL